MALPLVHSHDAFHGSESLRDVILIEWTSLEGVRGWGECSTLTGSGYVTETTDEAWDSLVHIIGPRVLRGDHSDQMEILPGTPAAGAAMRDARLDAYLRGRGASLTTYLGAAHTPLERCAVIAAVGETPERIAERAAAQVRSGAAMVKVKIAPGHDRDVLAAVMDAVHPLPVAADANGAYATAAEIQWIDELDLAYIEQPFPALLTPTQLGEEAARLGTPVALDESVTSLAALRALARERAGAAVSIKAIRLGGIESAVAIGRTAMGLGLSVFVGGMLETGIGRAGALAVASALALSPAQGSVRGSASEPMSESAPDPSPPLAPSLPTDLGPSSNYFAVDVCDPIECDDVGLISAPLGAGIGREPSTEILDRFTVGEVLLSR
ncbi:MAG: enolase C-terminal domain-like protein [Microthrixaceae bacterium]